jgi:hypothetical protein
MNAGSRGRALAAVVALTVVTACAGEPGKGSFPSFVRNPADRPVIGSGVAGLPTLVADPCVLADDEGYHLFYSAFFCREPEGRPSFSFDPTHPEACSFQNPFGSTAYAFSADRGLTWELRSLPVVFPGADDWSSQDIETPWVLRSGDRLFLFYSALGRREKRYQLGVATLDLHGRSIRSALMDEGAVFTSKPEPLIPADFQTPFGINNAQEPSVVVRDGLFDLFFVSLGLSHPDAELDSKDQDVSIALRSAVFSQDLAVVAAPSVPIATTASANIPEVRYFDGELHLFGTTTALDDHEDDFVTHAVSDDGGQFTAPERVLRRRDEGFDNWGLMAPTVVVEDDVVIMFYTAWESQDHHCVLEGPDGRVGMPVESRPQEARCLYGTLGRAISPRSMP